MMKKQSSRAAPKRRTTSKSKTKSKKPSSFASDLRRSQRDDALSGAADDGGAQDRLIGRHEAARILKCSVGKVRRHQKSRDLHPVVVDKVDGTVLYALREVTALAEQLNAPPAQPSADDAAGERDAAAFALLDARPELGDLVTQLKMPVAAARQKMHEWADLRGGMYVSGDALVRLQRFHPSDGMPIRTAEDLIRFLEEVVAPTCTTCDRNPVFCIVCFARRPPRAREIAELAMHRAEQQRADDEQRQFEQSLIEQARQCAAPAAARPAPAASRAAACVPGRGPTRPRSTS